MPLNFQYPGLWLPLVVLSLLLPATASLGGDDNRQQLEKVRDQMQHIQTDLSNKRKRRSEVQQELMSTEKDIGRQSRELKRLEREIADQRQRIRVAKIQQGLNRNSLESQRKEMEKQIRAAYIIGRQERVRLLLNQQDPELLGRLMVYHDYFNRWRVEQLSLIQTTLERLQLGEQTMLAEEQKMLQLQGQKGREKAALEKTRAGRKELIASLNQDITSDSTRLEELKRDEERLQKLLVQIRRKVSKKSKFVPHGSSFQSQRGRLHWPAKGRFKARFGAERRGGLKWDGVLISAPEGEEVHAVCDGKVVFSDWLRGFGLLLILDHGDGYMTLYGHNQSLEKQEGDLVRAEEVVAVLGNSGGQSESGVYFAVRHNGEPINPEPWFR